MNDIQKSIILKEVENRDALWAVFGNLQEQVLGGRSNKKVSALYYSLKDFIDGCIPLEKFEESVGCLEGSVRLRN